MELRFMCAANTSECKNICKQFGIFNYLEIPQRTFQGLWTGFQNETQNIFDSLLIDILPKV